MARAALQRVLLSHFAQKLWYVGPLFRYERPEAGRQVMAVNQIEVEWLGAESARSHLKWVLRGLQIGIKIFTDYGEFVSCQCAMIWLKCFNDVIFFASFAKFLKLL